VEAGSVKCWRCREPIPPGAKWDLGHVEGGGRHPEHAACNRAAGARTRNDAYVLVPRTEAARRRRREPALSGLARRRPTARKRGATVEQTLGRSAESTLP
jgi:hypothetical protein